MSYDTTIIIPTFNRPREMLERAIDSARAQTHECRVVVYNDGERIDYPRVHDYQRPARADAPYITWLQAAWDAPTPYVVYCYDDDWFEPTLIERQHRLLASRDDRDSIAYVCAAQDVRWASGLVQPNLNLGVEGMDVAELVVDKRAIGGWLMQLQYTLSPCGVLFRRDSVVRSINHALPLCPWRGVHAGQDLWMMLAPLLEERFETVGWICETLIHFGAHAGSTTVSAMQDPARNQALLDTYADIRRLYDMLGGPR